MPHKDFWTCGLLVGPNRRCLRPSIRCWITKDYWNKNTIRSVCQEHENYSVDDAVLPEEMDVMLIMER